eukprot:CAMPEP_0114443660 /NCGR_PEP_ID=MMETSP0103-20121206/17646_1 /TAXON_ID=37642 ORGANISM="Paraphysomonas imperforata, Strain PA2" /NCGR_SAMPLE_ID=MMETSP0103 /ASSEMBLY_ACC=CAM_ASM_000201 /LENGTH=65 /DNA_ID=CAMNT_0001615095 /DNA_START=385 /DNA_END=582 /DNA_ORIENTATION=+
MTPNPTSSDPSLNVQPNSASVFDCKTSCTASTVGVVKSDISHYTSVLAVACGRGISSNFDQLVVE